MNDIELLTAISLLMYNVFETILVLLIVCTAIAALVWWHVDSKANGKQVNHTLRAFALACLVLAGFVILVSLLLEIFVS